MAVWLYGCMPQASFQVLSRPEHDRIQSCIGIGEQASGWLYRQHVAERATSGMRTATLGLPPIVAACLRLAFRCYHVWTVAGYIAVYEWESKPAVSSADRTWLEELPSECRVKNHE
jgi:hypothetical protein